MRCWNCRRPSGYREQVLKAIGGLAIALANDGKLEEAQQELDTLQKKATPRAVGVAHCAPLGAAGIEALWGCFANPTFNVGL